MKLWDILNASQYDQVFSIYKQNCYDQNIPIARGTRPQMLDMDAEVNEEDLFRHMMHEVEYFSINKDGVMVIFLKSENYEGRVEDEYSSEAVERWDRGDPKTRPWLHGIETEEYTDKYLWKFASAEKEE